MTDSIDGFSFPPNILSYFPFYNHTVAPSTSADILWHVSCAIVYGQRIFGIPVATVWPDESTKVFFCSLLSPLDLYFSWDRICRTMWDMPVTRANRLRLEESIIRPLTIFLIKELGYNPLVAGKDGIRIDHSNIQIDAHEFYKAVVEGLELLSFSSHAAALKKLSLAKSLYVGSYLPGMTGKIIENAQRDLDSLYRSAVLVGIWHTRQVKKVLGK